MADHYTLTAIRLLIVVLGFMVVYLSFKSHRKHHSSSMLFVSIGFTFITVGVVVAGALFEFFAFDIFTALTIESILVATGFLAIVYSIYGTRS